MSIRWFIAIFICGSCASLAAPSEDYSIERYKQIIERAPFGAATQPDAQTAGANAASELAARQYRLTMIVNEGARGACVGIIDMQTQKSYVLFMGQPTPEGMELKEVRIEAEEADIRIGTQVITLKIAASAGSMNSGQGALRSGGMSRSRSYPSRGFGPGGSARTPPTSPATMSLRPTGATTVQMPNGTGTITVSGPGTTAQGGVQTVQVMDGNSVFVVGSATTAPPPQPALQGAELERHLREYNLQNIRAGGPPLPIQLTPEEDAQLVKEGVLPAP